MDKNLMKTGQSAGSQNLANRVCAKAVLRRSSAPCLTPPSLTVRQASRPCQGMAFFSISPATRDALWCSTSQRQPCFP